MLGIQRIVRRLQSRHYLCLARILRDVQVLVLLDARVRLELKTRRTLHDGGNEPGMDVGHVEEE